MTGALNFLVVPVLGGQNKYRAPSRRLYMTAEKHFWERMTDQNVKGDTKATLPLDGSFHKIVPCWFD
ncbi:Hypothetical predicted protein [Podarcis lilfordi]|uniref:Uncharacterized protein n=1 Tax=Podarcis lilfordi TaxID=74358 RepID=A0AA35NZN7_9SAUR|nr:Hypothetical predicted protein [Podarcis lilfordi]